MQTPTHDSRTSPLATRRRLARLAALGMLAPALAIGIAAHAQEWPAKPVTIVVPFPAGGSTDNVARMIAASLQAKYGQSFVVENRAGATGAIGAAAVKRAAPDGYTIMVASIGVYATNPFLQKDLPYDPVKDFDLVTVAVKAPNVLVAAPNFPAKKLPDLIAHLKKHPGEVSFASSGAGSSDHLTTALFWQKTQTTGVHVPYKGGAPAIADLLGGQVNVSFQNINVVVPHARAGKLAALAITGDTRSPVLPDVPTMDELGIKGVDVYSWQAVAVPKGTPAGIRNKLQADIAAAMNDPKNRKNLEDVGFEIVGNTPAQFDAFLKTELARWKNVIETGNITIN